MRSPAFNVLRLRTFGGLWLETPGAAGHAPTRPRPLALLAILAVAGSKGLTRDRILGVLWPDMDEDRARHALSQTLYLVRRDVGPDVVLSGPSLRLDAERITSDVAAFRAAVDSRRWTDAAALYVGPFLDGFYLADAPGFERWMESERASLATEGTRAIEIVARASADAGRLDEAAQHWHRLTRLDPADPRIALAYMNALAAAGDRGAALAHGKAYAELIRREHDTGLDPAIEELIARLREARQHTGIAPVAPAAPAPVVSVATVAEMPSVAADAGRARIASADSSVVAPTLPPVVRARSRQTLIRRRALVRTGLAGAIGLVALVGWRAATASSATPEPVLAVGHIRALAASDSEFLGAVAGEMLATSLGRVDALRVIASSRMLELTSRDADSSQTAMANAARRAGATEIIEGEVVPLGGRRVRLEVRRVDLARGLVRGGYRVAGTDGIALFDSVTALIAADLRLTAPKGSLAEVSTRSPVAYQFYEEGLRAFYQADAAASNRLFRSALREDSLFPMAAYYAWRTAKFMAQPDVESLADRAVALATRASPRDRLLILTHVGADRADPRALAAAETLVTRYPRDPEALVRAAEILPDLSRAIELFERSIAIDSVAAVDSTALCRRCDALNALTSRYGWADSAAAVERTLARWRRLRPNDPTPWALLADWLIGFGRRAEADAATRQFEALGGSLGNAHLVTLARSLRLDDVESANRICADGLTTAAISDFLRYRWYCVIALRMQGRYREAMALARDNRVPGYDGVRHVVGPEIYQRALLDMEMGRPGLAAGEFRAIDRDHGDTAQARAALRAHNTTWLMTLSATAAVAGGDTLRARALADTIEVLGQHSLFARDPRLHHFVRAMLHVRAHDDQAAVRELHAAIHSLTYGYTRINYELGQRLLALGRPAEGIPVVQAALHGGIEGPGLYVTRTELHELLAKLFDANHQRDSAAVHYAAVERAWRSADPEFRPRYEAALAGRGAAPKR